MFSRVLPSLYLLCAHGLQSCVESGNLNFSDPDSTHGSGGLRLGSVQESSKFRFRIALTIYQKKKRKKEKKKKKRVSCLHSKCAT